MNKKKSDKPGSHPPTQSIQSMKKKEKTKKLDGYFAVTTRKQTKVLRIRTTE